MIGRTRLAQSSMLLAIAFAFGIVTALAVQAQQKSGQGSSRAMKLSPQDYIDIQQLVNRYAHEIDMCVNNGYSYAEMYAPDGVFTDLYSDNGVKQGGIKSTGREALAEAAGGGKFNCRGTRRFELTHVVTNLVITPSPEGATGKALLLEMWPEPNEMNVNKRAGSYEDVYVKTAQGWKFKERAHVRKREKGDPRG